MSGSTATATAREGINPADERSEAKVTLGYATISNLRPRLDNHGFRPYPPSCGDPTDAAGGKCSLRPKGTEPNNFWRTLVRPRRWRCEVQKRLSSRSQ